MLSDTSPPQLVGLDEGARVPGLALDMCQGNNSVAELMHPARPVLLDLAGRPELREIAGGWAHREDIHTAGTDNQPADVILIRADAISPGPAPVGASCDTRLSELPQTPLAWFGLSGADEELGHQSLPPTAYPQRPHAEEAHHARAC
ncbi:hypothetical protein [Streptomyces sp. NPDC050507]|uniref:aromatic-ring hydroxylase C-terminal domain-containing protein n=1 Tax=Streptomyces sp. NPDC050507 TaxID=3365619 RepID=UPI0037AFD6D3